MESIVANVGNVKKSLQICGVMSFRYNHWFIQDWVSVFSGTRKSKLEILERNDQLMELILDISNELDIDVLCHKGRSTDDAHETAMPLNRSPQLQHLLGANQQ